MAEYIERSKVAEMLDAVYENGWTTKYSVEMYLNEAQKTLMFLPGADVEEVKHGHWIYYPECGVTKCSVCHHSVEECVEYPRCMFCGAYMDEGERK